MTYSSFLSELSSCATTGVYMCFTIQRREISLFIVVYCLLFAVPRDNVIVLNARTI